MARLIDITNPIVSGTEVRPGDPATKVEIGDFTLADGRTLRAYHGPLHAGTHTHAPSYIVKGGKTIDQVPVDTFMGDTIVVDLKDKAPSSGITSEDFEGAIGSKIKEGDIVLMRSGWGEKLGTREFLEEAPYLTMDGARWLVSKKVKLVALDCMHAKFGAKPPEYPPLLLMSEGIPMLVDVKGLDQIKKERVTLVAFPIKIQGVEAAPTRAIVIEED